jgi:hypothetical protein
LSPAAAAVVDDGDRKDGYRKGRNAAQGERRRRRQSEGSCRQASGNEESRRRSAETEADHPPGALPHPVREHRLRDAPRRRPLRHPQTRLGAAAAPCRLSEAGRLRQGLQVAHTGQASFVCAGDTALEPGLASLSYGTASRVGGSECISRSDGVTCVNQTGHGFFISVQSYQVF